MRLSDLISKMNNGAAHLIIFNADTGEIIAKTIWYNLIPHTYFNWEIDTIEVRDYELRVGIHD